MVTIPEYVFWDVITYWRSYAVAQHRNLQFSCTAASSTWNLKSCAMVTKFFSRKLEAKNYHLLWHATSDMQDVMRKQDNLIYSLKLEPLLLFLSCCPPLGIRNLLSMYGGAPMHGGRWCVPHSACKVFGKNSHWYFLCRWSIVHTMLVLTNSYVHFSVYIYIYCLVSKIKWEYSRLGHVVI